MLVPAFPQARRTRPLLALLVALPLLGVLLALAAPQAASAASPLPDQARRADEVFTGTVTHATTSKKPSGQRGATTTYDVDVQRVYKGQVQQESVQVTVDASTRSCRLGALEPRRRYVFFATEAGRGLTADGCSGTGRATAALVADVEKLLGDGRPPVPPAPQRATLSPVAHSAPTAFPRLAAPGAAAVLVGLLGLVVVRRLARRS